jgi:transposase
MRKLLVGSAHYALGPFGEDSDLGCHGEDRWARKNVEKRAVIAVARKPSVPLHRLWVTAEVYKPLYDANRRGDRVA